MLRVRMKRLRFLLAAIMALGFMLLAVPGLSSQASADLAPITSQCPDGSYARVCPTSTDQCKQQGNLAVCLTKSKVAAWKLYLINLGIESVVAAGFVLLLKKSKRLIWAVIVVNLVSWPILYNSVSHFQTTKFLILAEIAVWAFEAVGIYALCSKQTTPKQAVALSTITNASTILASFLLFR